MLSRRRVDGVEAAFVPPVRHRRDRRKSKDSRKTPHQNDRLQPWIDLLESTRSMGSKVGIAAMPFAIRSQCHGLNVDETVGRFV